MRSSCIARVAGLAVLLSGLGSAHAGAEKLAVSGGTQVRITTAGAGGSERVSGTVLANSPSGLLISSPGRSASVTVPADRIEKLEIRTGGISHGAGFVRGVGVGVLVGASLGALLGVAAAGDEAYVSSAEAAAYGALVLGVVGIPVGGLIGLAASGVDYAEVPLPASAVAVSLGSSRDQDLVVATSWRF